MSHRSNTVMKKATAGVAVEAHSSSHSRLPHFPALDGIRGAGLVIVLLTHAEIGWGEGGFIGLTAFFTLSGFLITSLLLVERHNTGGVRLSNFWVRRARRLVPGIVVSFALIAALVPSIDRPPRGLIGDALASSFWVANWRFVFEDRTYADIFSSPSPFQHFWSLAVEEQFYLLFPLLLVGLVWRQKGIPRARLAVVIGGLAIASLAISFAVADPSSPYRAYYGTDVRAAEILVGALLAVALCRRVTAGGSGLPRPLSQVIGIAGLAGMALAYVALDEFDPRIFEGGFFAVAVASAMMITSAIDHGTVAQRVLSLRPLVFLGTISYGTYLYHWPIFLAVTERSTGLGTVPLLVVRLALTFALAIVSHRFVEEPIRRNGLPARLGPPAWINGAVAGVALVALASGEVAPATTARADAALGTVLSAGTPESAPVPSSIATPTSVASPSTITSAPSGERSRSSSGATGGSQATSAGPAPIASTTTTRPEPTDTLPPAFYEDPGDAEVPAPPSDAQQKLRVVMLGDSVGANLGKGIIAWAEERGDVAVLNLALPACPLSRGGERRFSEEYPFPVDEACAWWADPSSERYQALQDFDPHVVLVEDGMNEMLDRRLPEWNEWRRPGDPRYESWVRSEINEALEIHAGSASAKVISVTAPCADWGRYESFDSVSTPDLRIRSLNTNVYSRLGSDVIVADLFSRVCPAGTFTNEVEGVQEGRPDGLHFSDEAAAALARNWLGPMVLEAAGQTSASGTLIP